MYENNNKKMKETREVFSARQVSPRQTLNKAKYSLGENNV